MKTLDSAALLTGIEEIRNKIEQQKQQMKQIEDSVRELTNLEDSLKGKGGQAIRSFYEDCHIPFLSYYQMMMADYNQALHEIKQTLKSIEPAENAFIRESFLTNEIENGLQKAKSVTEQLTNDANSIISRVQDIVSLPELDDSQVVDQFSTAKRDKDLTLELLHTFDSQQETRLDSVTNNVLTMNNYVSQIDSMFQSKDLSISTYKTGLLYEALAKNPSSVSGTPGSSVNNPEATTAQSAVGVLNAFKLSQDLELSNNTAEESDVAGFMQAFGKGALDSLLPLGVIALSQKTGLLRIEYTKKKNHYTFKYNQKVLNFLKGKTGPKAVRHLIQQLNRESKKNAQIEKMLKDKNSNIKKARYVDNRSFAEKSKAFAVKAATGNKPVHETLKKNIFKNTDRNMLIDRKKFPMLAGRLAGTGAIVAGAVNTGTTIRNRIKEIDNKSGKEFYEAGGRIIGEEVNKLAGSATGAAVGTYVGAAIGGALSGPFAPFGAAAGAVIGGAIGASVGEWGSKYTSKWMGDAGAAIGKASHDVKEKASKALDSAKDALDDAKDKVFGWL
ncbi:LXG domain-containing protein [Fictibacillus iocasae]|uniref:LXG domain-containing protein n=1 Tax=Fictibacillus iocasae TaxID=2715437 RepID=A0ABW2NVR4_9BACL